MDQETEAKIAEIQAAFAENKEKALEKMMEAIVRVQAEPHRNARV